jgi:hypothetical protein
MYANIDKGKSHVKRTNVASSFRLRDKISKAHHTVEEEENSALIHHFHTHVEVRLKRPEREQENDSEDGNHYLYK